MPWLLFPSEWMLKLLVNANIHRPGEILGPPVSPQPLFGMGSVSATGFLVAEELKTLIRLPIRDNQSRKT